MSRTDVHAPYRVKARDPGWRGHFTEYHNHTWRLAGGHREPGPPPRWVRHWRRVTACDLGAYLAGAENTACCMTLVYRGRNLHCGCHLCVGGAARRLARRRERVAWRSTRARVLAERSWDEAGPPGRFSPAW